MKDNWQFVGATPGGTVFLIQIKYQKTTLKSIWLITRQWTDFIWSNILIELEIIKMFFFPSLFQAFRLRPNPYTFFFGIHSLKVIEEFFEAWQALKLLVVMSKESTPKFRQSRKCETIQSEFENGNWLGVNFVELGFGDIKILLQSRKQHFRTNINKLLLSYLSSICQQYTHSATLKRLW